MKCSRVVPVRIACPFMLIALTPLGRGKSVSRDAAAKANLGALADGTAVVVD